MKNFTFIKHCLGMFVLSISLIITLLFTATASPKEETDVPVFSQKSGFYEDAFYLEIKAPDHCEVYYTLDSSDPTRQSLRYTEPIYIQNASLNDNVYSMIPGMSAQPFAVEPDFLIDKCTVVRAVAIPKDGLFRDASEVVTESYFVGFDPDHFDNLPVISIVTDPDNLFSSKSGIYVGGDMLKKYLQISQDPEAEYWQYWPANYWIKGPEGEREANITFFDSTGTPVEQKDIGIRIQGGWSRSQVPRSLNLYSREKYDGQAYFSNDYFGTSHQLQTMTLSNGGNQYVTRINDYLVSERVRGLPFSVMSFEPCVMFLDGEYWGFYWLTEKYDAVYIQNAYHLDTSDIIMIKAQEVAEGYSSDLLLYQQLLDFFASHDMSEHENYVKACELIDIDSCIDYFATLIYLSRSLDWPNANEALWRTREITDEPFADGKWRWMLFDCNTHACMSANLIEHNTLQMVIEESVIFDSLWSNESFRASFQQRIFEIADEYFDPADISGFIDDYNATMTPVLSKTWDRFFGKDNDLASDFEAALENIYTFFLYRREVVASWFS